jgi:hypothetical protein
VQVWFVMRKAPSGWPQSCGQVAPPPYQCVTLGPGWPLFLGVDLCKEDNEVPVSGLLGIWTGLTPKSLLILYRQHGFCLGPEGVAMLRAGGCRKLCWGCEAAQGKNFYGTLALAGSCGADRE